MSEKKTKPLGLHLVQGSQPEATEEESTQRPEAETKVATDKIERPGWLKHNPIAQKEWRQIVPELTRLGLLTNIDTTALGMYCEAVSNYVQAIEDIKERGPVVEYTNKASKTNIVENPSIRVKKKNYQIIKDMLKEFGLTPAARASLALRKGEDKEKAEDPLGRFGDL